MIPKQAPDFATPPRNGQPLVFWDVLGAAQMFRLEATQSGTPRPGFQLRYVSDGASTDEQELAQDLKASHGKPGCVKGVTLHRQNLSA